MMTLKDVLILFNRIQVTFQNTPLLERILDVINMWIALYLMDILFNILKDLLEQLIAGNYFYSKIHS